MEHRISRGEYSDSEKGTHILGEQLLIGLREILVRRNLKLQMEQQTEEPVLTAVGFIAGQHTTTDFLYSAAPCPGTRAY